jgi:hypothetical protein
LEVRQVLECASLLVRGQEFAIRRKCEQEHEVARYIELAEQRPSADLSAKC